MLPRIPLLARTANPGSSLHGGNSNQHGQKLCDHWEGCDHQDDKDKESPSGAGHEQDGEEVSTIVIGNHRPAITCPTPTVKDEMLAMCIRLLFSQIVAENLVVNHGIDATRILAIPFDDDITAICDVLEGLVT